MLRAIAPHVETDLTAPERLSLLDDEWALVRAGRHTRRRLPDAGRRLRPRAHQRRARRSRAAASRVDRRLSDDARRRGRGSRRSSRSLLRPLFDELGFTARRRRHRRPPLAARDADRRARHRRPAIRTSIAKARAALDRALAGGPPLDPTAAGAIVTRRGHARRREAVRRAGRSRRRGDVARRALSLSVRARPTSSDPALIERGLERTLSPQLRSQDTALYLARFFANPRRAGPAPGRSSRSTGAALEPKVTIFGGDTNLIRVAGRVLRRGAARRHRGVLRRAPAAGRGADADPDARADQQLHRAAREADAGGHRLAGGALDAATSAGRSDTAAEGRLYGSARHARADAFWRRRHRGMARDPGAPRRLGADADADARPPGDRRRARSPRSSMNSRSPSRSSRFSASVIPIAIVRLPGPRQRSWVAIADAGAARPSLHRPRAAPPHHVDAVERIERADQHRRRRAVRFGDDVHETVDAVVQVDVGVAGRAVERRVARRRARRRVTRRIGLADVGLDLDDRRRWCGRRADCGRGPCRADRAATSRVGRS